MPARTSSSITKIRSSQRRLRTRDFESFDTENKKVEPEKITHKNRRSIQIQPDVSMLAAGRGRKLSGLREILPEFSDGGPIFT